MISYFIPLIFLSALATAENLNKFENIIKNKFFYSSVGLIIIIFIGFRHEVGCDWEAYTNLIEKYKLINVIEILKYNFHNNPEKFKLPDDIKYDSNTFHIIQELGHVLLAKISGNIYILNFIYGIIFSFPLFLFCSKLKRVYLSLVISYPYYIIVIGMGPIRQAACISILMLSIIFVSNKKYYQHLFATSISLLIHQYSIIFNLILLTPWFKNNFKNGLSKKNIIFIFFIFAIILFNSPSYINKTIFYILSSTTESKGAIFIWIINSIPAIFFLSNLNKFKFKKDLKQILISFSVIELMILPLIFFKSLIAYRLLLYFFPTSIFISSYIPDLNIIKLKRTNIINMIIAFSFISQIIWFKFAFHASCWLPYKNILLI